MVLAALRARARRVAEDTVLCRVGACLALAHVLLAVAWSTTQPLAAILAPDQPAVCWPFLPDCAALHGRLAPHVTSALAGYAGLAGLTAVLLARRKAGLGLALLLVLTGIEIGTVALDYRLRLNQHLMQVTATLAFVVLPSQRRLLRYLVAGFYFWAGLLKLNAEWLSGAALPTLPLGVPAGLMPAAALYVVLLELSAPFGLTARRASWRWLTLAQLVGFHVASWPVVGFHYPLLMALLLAVFPLCEGEPDDARPGLRRLVRGTEALSTRAALALFGALQIVPRLYPGDTALSGEGRLFALHMFDARVECQAGAVLHSATGSERRVPIEHRLPPRIQCDPIVYLGDARALCRKLAGKAGVTSIDLWLRSRRTSDTEQTQVLDLRDVCSTRPEYRWLGHNAWIFPAR